MRPARGRVLAFLLAAALLASSLLAASLAFGSSAPPAPTQVVIRAAARHREGLCMLHNQSFDCAPMIDPVWYAATYADVRGLSPDALAAHWRDRGFGEGRRAHPGLRTLKVVLMTKNEWPLVRSNVLYHAHVFGGSNVYVLDASASPNVLAFLEEARLRLGVHVVYSTTPIGALTNDLDSLFRAIMFSADYLFKLDTDEFILLDSPATKNEGTAEVLSRPASPATTRLSIDGLREYLDSLPIDGSAYIISKWAWGAPVDDRCEPGMDAASTQRNFSIVLPSKGSMMKSFFAAGSFGHCTLGSHHNAVRKPFRNREVSTRIAIAHFKWPSCFDSYIASQRQVVMGHGYIEANANLDTQLRQCSRPLLQVVQSGHKFGAYCAYLRSPDRFREAYFSSVRPFPNVTGQLPRPGALVYDGLRERVTQLTSQWIAGAADSATIAKAVAASAHWRGVSR